MLDSTLLTTLEKVGFDDKEARVYLALVELGKGTATDIANRAGIKRAIVYHVVERLKKRGYATDIPGTKVQQFTASDPITVLQSVRTATDDLKYMVPLMRALQHKGAEKPRIEFFDDKEAIVATYRMFGKSTQSRFIAPIERLEKFIPEEVASWERRWKASRVKGKEKILLMQTEKDRAFAQSIIAGGGEARILPKEMQMEMDFAILDDMIGITSFDPFFVVVIYSEKIAQSAAILFDLAWTQGQKLDTLQT